MNISKELQQTVKSNNHISDVYFDKLNRHYFNVHSLKADPTDENSKEELYGSGLYSHNQIIPGKTNIDNLTEIISKGDPETLIVKKMTREEVIAATPENNDETIASKILNSSPEEKQVILASLGLTPDVLELLSGLKGEKKEEKPTIKLG